MERKSPCSMDTSDTSIFYMAVFNFANSPRRSQVFIPPQGPPVGWACHGPWGSRNPQDISAEIQCTQKAFISSGESHQNG